MEFEKWLEKHQVDSWECNSGIGGNEAHISIKALGEWAYLQIKNTLKSRYMPKFDSIDFYLSLADDEGTIQYYEIAVACLGKKEILKRMKREY